MSGLGKYLLAVASETFNTSGTSSKAAEQAVLATMELSEDALTKIGNPFDTKLAPIKQEVYGIKTELSTVKNDVATAKEQAARALAIAT